MVNRSRSRRRSCKYGVRKSGPRLRSGLMPCKKKHGPRSRSRSRSASRVPPQFRRCEWIKQDGKQCKLAKGTGCMKYCHVHAETYNKLTGQCTDGLGFKYQVSPARRVGSPMAGGAEFPMLPVLERGQCKDKQHKRRNMCVTDPNCKWVKGKGCDYLGGAPVEGPVGPSYGTDSLYGYKKW